MLFGFIFGKEKEVLYSLMIGKPDGSLLEGKNFNDKWKSITCIAGEYEHGLTFNKYFKQPFICSMLLSEITTRLGSNHLGWGKNGNQDTINLSSGYSDCKVMNIDI